MSGDSKRTYTAEEEREIIDRLCGLRDAQAPIPTELAASVNALFNAAQPRVYGVCRKITGDPERARELCQESLLIGYRKLGAFRGEGRLSTWLYGIARGEALNAIRRKQDMLSEDGIIEAGDPSLGVLSSFRKEEREAVLRAASATLSAPEREAIHLRYVEGLPQDRITEILGLTSKSGARGLLQSSRRHLKRALREELERLGHGSSFFDVTR